MQADTAARLLDELRREIASPAEHPVFEVPVDYYRSDTRLARERGLFASAPRIALASSALAPGGCSPRDIGGESLLLVRDLTGTVRGFYNACRHRATRLVDEPCTAKALVCPYHGWTYDLQGLLRHVPHAEAFARVTGEALAPGDRPRLDLANRGLREVPVVERHGLIWIGSHDVAPYLGRLDAELAALSLDRHVVWRTVATTRRCNWKLVVEAFLDGYHIRTLHRDSIYRFFIDAATFAERAGDHVLAMTARRTLRDGAIDADPRTLATPSFLLFPATTVIIHPDFVSVIIVHPLAPDVTEYEHLMLVPADRADDREHWDRSWNLIEATVFQREDLWVCEQVQRGLGARRADVTDTLTFGALEVAVRWFHDAIERGLALRN